MSTTEKRRWWGWGTVDRHFDAQATLKFMTAIKAVLPHRASSAPVALPSPERHSIPPTKLSVEFISAWKTRGLSTDSFERLCHATGKSYYDLLRLRSGHLDRYPDGVLFLEKKTDLTALFADAHTYGVTLIPFGGGTSVVGGIEAVTLHDRPVLVVDLSRLSQLVAIDDVSRTATFEAGVFGPALESALNAKGYTLGHFPQSFEFSTLGGWAATRSAGQNSTKYGKIEKLVTALEVYTPQGVIRTQPLPAAAVGPSLNELLVGSEGLYGIITEVTVKISPVPEQLQFISAFFRDFDSGVTYIRQMIQNGLKPSIVRLSDNTESSLFINAHLSSGWKRRLLTRWFQYKKLGDSPCLLLLGIEGKREEVAWQQAHIRQLLKAHGGVLIRKNMGQAWKKDRFSMPYLRDPMMDDGLVIDTFETATTWTELGTLYQAVKRALGTWQAQSKEALLLGCHLSHTYGDGASLYFTVIGHQRSGHEVAQWREIKSVATDVIVNHGAALSHHHGIGHDHRPWMNQAYSDLSLNVFKTIKDTLDPQSLLNPGKLL